MPETTPSQGRPLELTELLTLLLEVSEQLSSTLDLDNPGDRIYAEMRRLFDAENFFIARFSSERQQVLLDLEVLGGQRRPRRSRPLENGLIEYILRTRKPLLVREEFREEMHRLNVQAMENVGCFCGVPVVLYDRAVGVMAVFSREEKAFDETHLELMMALASSAGIALEKMTWGSWTPHKFKMAVSACPRNCAEATIKDFGVVGIEGAWELHIGGNGGLKVRVTDLLCRVKTDAEVFEYCGAFMQLYREQARYLERTAPWVERVGLPYIKQHVVDDAASRQALYARFIAAQRVAQQDPWAVRAKEEHRLEFVPMQPVTAVLPQAARV